MTRRLRPPVPLNVQCCSEGEPLSLRRGGRLRTISRIAACWVRPAPWWSDEEDSADDPLRGERTYYRVIVEGVAAYEIFRSARGGRWYIETIID